MPNFAIQTEDGKIHIVSARTEKGASDWFEARMRQKVKKIKQDTREIPTMKGPVK